MDTASCRVMPPASFSRFMKSWSRPSAAILRSCVRLASSCHASLAGYQGIATGGFSTSPLTWSVLWQSLGHHEGTNSRSCTRSATAVRCGPRR